MIRLFGVCVLLAASAIVFGQTGEEKKGRKPFDPETMFKKLDKDADGKLTRAEYEAFFERLGEKAAKFKEAALKRFDEAAGKDKSLTLEQFKKFQALQSGGFNSEAVFKKIDKDGNGKVSKAEYQAMVDRFVQRFSEKIGEDKAAKMKEAMLKRFDEAAGKEGEITLEQFQKIPRGKGEFKRKQQQ